MRQDLPADVAANVQRIDTMWSDCRTRFGGDGPFLFGRFSAADAMYAPVVSRFHTYDVPVSPASRAYMQAVMALPAWAQWKAAALTEEWVLEEDEPDWPTVHKVPEARAAAAR
jgi:glutathione S-transferase